MPSKPWFRPERYEYGSGLPIAWQGWVVRAVYLLIVIGALAGVPTLLPGPNIVPPVAAVIVVISSLILVVICARKTEGGWRWRWGKRR
jgi:hypothetical protein